jgi:Xaa-Pro dipeptidase
VNQKYFDRLLSQLEKTDYAGVLVAPSAEFQFLVGHTPSMGARFEGLFVLRDGRYFHICPLLSQEEMSELLGAESVHAWSDGDGYLGTVDDCADLYGLRGQTIAVNQHTRAFHVLEIAEAGIMQFTSGKVLMEEMRIIKDSEEMENLRVASRLADDVFQDLLAFIQPGMTEKDVINEIRASFRKRGVAGHGMVAVGANASKPHYNRSDRIIGVQDLVLMDYGCVYNGMYSDITRTVFVGQPTEKQKEVYKIVKEANEAAIQAIRLGVKASEIDAVARNIIAEAGYGEYFLSRLGHGIGYAGHEAPDIKGSNHRQLETGMAFSIEPGIYLPGEFGVRIEDIILMGPDGVENLNHAPKDLIVIESRKA